MTIDFHDAANRSSYAQRSVNDSWKSWLSARISFPGKKAADIGCGGGIYTKALIELGAAEAVGIDFSEAMLAGAAENCAGLPQIAFWQGTAQHTGLPGGKFDIILERALIHHLSHPDLLLCFKEAHRLLADTGMLIVQDRTPEDCLLPGNAEHIRGYFFEKYRWLAPFETARRHPDEVVCQALAAAGFQTVETETLWETRASYSGMEALRSDLMARTGRSILHELADRQLEELCDFIEERAAFKTGGPIVEKDRWTVWLAVKQ
ncbi:class I SAM-dependent methyltransferase [Paenibacillus hamazuiensis]|uniref:class I SAM-dependent methyltransferase n=1 Tax=Paenibacillus hamazuiensis TaxID=2936508 RepID=UPI00200F05D1|nr:class I SAM-dependent methyltransferase [Paenibacillus hamazuiensis]